MGLYDALPSAKDEQKANGEGAAKKEGWVGSGLFAPTSLAAKRAAMMAPPSVPRGGSAAGRGRGREGPPPVAMGRGGAGGRAGAKGSGDALLAAAAGQDGPITVTATAVPVVPGMSLGENIQDEYDPAKPNDYDAVRRAREQQRREAEIEAERQERLREERQRQQALRAEQEERMREMRELEALELQRMGDMPAQQGAVPAAPGPQQGDDEQRRAALQLSGDEAWRRRGAAAAPAGDGWGPGGLGSGGELGSSGGLGSGGGLGLGGSTAPPPTGSGQPKGMSLAQKLLEKMGWKEGEGLGRNRQGMATPLMMQKTDVRTGVIVNAAPSTAEQPAKRQRTATFNGPPTRVVLLTNMVGPGEVDAHLDGEVGEECSKYGTVTNVMIFEVTEPGFPADQAVRIFVQFERVEEATKALVDLQGRFFGGREVEAGFFEEDRFERKELAPRPEEVRR